MNTTRSKTLALTLLCVDAPPRDPWPKECDVCQETRYRHRNAEAEDSDFGSAS